jgi:TolA-binding protein
MSVVDLHPEDLLDKEIRGELSESERAHLDAHLTACDTCRFERRARALFAEEHEGIEPAPYSAKLLAVAIGAATQVATPPTTEPSAESPTEAARKTELSPEPRTRSHRFFWYFAAATLLAVSTAVASESAGRWVRHAVGWGERPLEVQTSTAARKKEGVVLAATALPAVEPVLLKNVDEPPVPVSEPPTPIAAPPEPMAVARAMTSEQQSPSALFDAANDARRRGDYARAIELNRRLEERFPESREAHLSLATVGRLLLDRGDLGSALASFDAYQKRGHGDLDEAAMVGRAMALDRLGRGSDGRRAWQELLTSFPSSPYAGHARARLDREPYREP